MLNSLRWLILASFSFGYVSAHAAILIDGLEITIAGGGNCDLTSCPDVGDHFHSDVYFGRLAEVGGYAASGSVAVEEIRGMAEFDLTGMSHVSAATLTFMLYRQGGMFVFEGGNAEPFTGNILVDAYEGNNSIFGNGFDFDTNFEAAWTDYEEASIRHVGDFDVVGGATPSPNVGAVITFNITGLLNEAIAHDLTSLGIRLRQDRTGEDYGLASAWTFSDFWITANQAPEPPTLALVVVGLAGLALGRRKRA